MKWLTDIKNERWKENYKLSISEKVIYTTKVKRNIEND